MTQFTVQELLGDDGLIARRLPDYELRPQQVEFAEAVTRALAERRHLVAEAGTGVGKSFAYLLPAVLYATEHVGEGPVVVSTRTIALQEQLEHKDLPFLNAVMPLEWSTVTAVGRNNYLCLRRLQLAFREQAALFDDAERRAQLQRVIDWSLSTREGTKMDLPKPVLPAVWEEVQAEHGNCLHRACPHFEPCHYQRSRRRMQSAQILVVNHALYMADVALRMAGAAYLPPHRVVVFDEAHHLERVATESLGLRLSATTVGWHLRRLHPQRSRRSLLAEHGSPRAMLLFEEVRGANDAFFAELDDRLQRAGRGEGVALESERLTEPLTEPLSALAEEVTVRAMEVQGLDLRMELLARAQGLQSVAATVQALCAPPVAPTGDARTNPPDDDALFAAPPAAPALVRWIEPGRRGPSLRGAPLEVREALRHHVFGGECTAVLTSATLGAGEDGRFSWMRRQLGLDGEVADRVDCVQLGSPFQYDSAVELVVEQGLPDPGREPAGFRRDAAELTLRHVLDNGGRALVLCTSWQFVRALAEHLRRPLVDADIRLLVQGEAPLTRLLQQKRDEPTSVLLGTDSLWEGIDVRGDALTLVVVTRLPFASPGHPLTKARLQAIAKRGGDAFLEQSLPEAILKFRQGFGRLIRSERDRGKVVVLDPRARTRPYGRRFIAALPFE